MGLKPLLTNSKQFDGKYAHLPFTLTLVPGVLLIPLQIATKLSMTKFESVMKNQKSTVVHGSYLLTNTGHAAKMAVWLVQVSR